MIGERFGATAKSHRRWFANDLPLVDDQPIARRTSRTGLAYRTEKVFNATRKRSGHAGDQPLWHPWLIARQCLYIFDENICSLLMVLKLSKYCKKAIINNYFAFRRRQC